MSLRNPDHVFDELLVMQYRAGDQKAMELLIKRWNKKIIMYAYRNIQNSAGAQDVAQEVWLGALKGIHLLKDHMKVGSWLLGITHNKSMDWLKRNQAVRQEVATDRSLLRPDNTEEDNEDLSTMRKAMRELSNDHQNILSLFYLEGFTIIEIANILDTSKGTVKSRLFYARESLKEKIKQNNHE